MPAYKLGTLPFYLTGEILLQPRPGIPIEQILKIIDNRAKVKHASKYNTYVLETDDWDKLLQYSNRIYESGLVSYCHPNFIAPIERTTDPLYPDQYYLNNTGQFGGTAGIDINAPEAWNMTLGSSTIKVAVIDDGVETHEELTGRVLQGYTPQTSTNNPDTHGAPNDNDPRHTDYPYDPDGPFGHGECCAGIIAASHNTIGIRGIAPKVQIVPVNIFNDWSIVPYPYSGYDSMLVYSEDANDIASAIDWAWDEGEADVLSNSWGYNTIDPDDVPYADNIIAAIDSARTQGRNGLGAVVVFASGNENENFSGVTFPANVDGVITVGAIDKNGSIWNYSSRGPEMDLVAPSGGIPGDVRTIDRMGSKGFETGNYYNYFNGTSAACPQVSGVAALMLSSNPFLTETQVRTTIQQTATDMGPAGFDNTYGYGRVNAYAAVEVHHLYVTGPSIVCSESNSTFTLHNTLPGSTVTWTAYNVTPSSGNDTVATFHSTCSNIGNTQVVFTITKDGRSTQVSKTFLSGGPDPTDVELDIYKSTGGHANKYGNTWVLCPNDNYEIFVINSSSCVTSNYTWILPSSLTKNYAWNNMVSVHTNSHPGGNIIVKAQTCCTSCGSNVQILSDYVGTDYSCGYGYMSFAPNPANDEVTLELKTESIADYEAGEVWSLDIYNQQQVLVKTMDNLRDTRQVIHTSGMKAGVYYVRVMIGNNMYSGKFVIER